MVVTRRDELIFVAAAIAGAAVWWVFALFKTEPWDTVYGVLALLAVGVVFGYVGNDHPVLWAIGIFVGQAIYGFASLGAGGGASLFLPLGLVFLVPFTLPALAGTFAGAALTRWR